MGGPAACKETGSFGRQTHTSYDPHTTNPLIKYTCAYTKQPHRPCMLSPAWPWWGWWGRGSVRGVVKVDRTIHCKMITHVIAYAETTQCAQGCIKKKAAPPGRNQRRQRVIKLKMHGCCKVYEGFSTLETTARHYYTVHVADTATKSTWRSHLGHMGIVYLMAYSLWHHWHFKVELKWLQTAICFRIVTYFL